MLCLAPSSKNAKKKKLQQKLFVDLFGSFLKLFSFVEDK